MKVAAIQDVLTTVADTQDGGKASVGKFFEWDGNDVGEELHRDGAAKDPLSFFIARSIYDAAQNNSTRAEAIDRVRMDLRYAIGQLTRALEAVPE